MRAFSVCMKLLIPPVYCCRLLKLYVKYSKKSTASLYPRPERGSGLNIVTGKRLPVESPLFSDS